MFKNTNVFFKKVARGEVSQIDINTYIQKVTDNHKLENLKILLNDIEFFIFIYDEDIRAEITTEMITKKISEYDAMNKEIPYYTIPELKSKKTGEIIASSKIIDIEKLFYPFEMFCIRQLRNYVNHLISSKTKQDNSINKYEHIFSNNGFELFEYILQNHISKETGRYEDLSYYYRRLYTDKYIHQKSTPFKEWFEETYNEYFTKIKTEIATKNPQRLNNYSTALEWFKSKK